MSKSILVIDTPETCSKCLLKSQLYDNQYICCGNHRRMVIPGNKNKPDWCPLKEVSEKDMHDYLIKRKNGWILCSERMPEEHETQFAKLKGTDKWRPAMFEKMSDEVNVTVEFEDGQRKTMALHTCDGKWMTGLRIVKFTVIAWMSLPEAYQDEEVPE